MRGRRKTVKISEAEWSIMKVLWDGCAQSDRGMTLGEIVYALSETSDWSNTTIRTLIIRLAEKGDLSKVDLLIGDISPDSVGNMNAAVTASNFGKISDEASQADLAAGLLNMVVQTVGLSAIFCGRAKGLKTIVLTGNLSRGAMRETLDMMEGLYGVRFLVPDDSEFAAAIGAAICGWSY
jgi:type II pantothenate kinase